jgi:hypothetical protein
MNAFSSSTGNPTKTIFGVLATLLNWPAAVPAQ